MESAICAEEREAVTLSNQGKKIFGIIHRPVMAGKAPAIVVFPGFAGNKSGKYRMFVEIGQQLAEQGIAVLRFDYRGSGDSDGEFGDITIDTQISDGLVCLNYLENDPAIDINRIGLLGRSLGGLISILAAAQFGGIKSLALMAPVYTSEPWKRMWEHVTQNRSESTYHELLKHLPNSIPTIPSVAFLKEFFQVNMKTELAKIQNIPLLHIHGKKDEIVKIEQARGYEEARRTEALSRFIQLPNTNHDFSDEKERIAAIAEICRWFQETL